MSERDKDEGERPTEPENNLHGARPQPPNLVSFKRWITALTVFWSLVVGIITIVGYWQQKSVMKEQARQIEMLIQERDDFVTTRVGELMEKQSQAYRKFVKDVSELYDIKPPEKRTRRRK